MSGSKKELWRRSESPVDVWDDVEKEWEFEIVDEELDEDGKTSRCAIFCSALALRGLILALHSRVRYEVR